MFLRCGTVAEQWLARVSFQMCLLLGWDALERQRHLQVQSSLLYSGAYFALSSWIADEEGAHAGSYVLCFNAWVLASAVRVVCSLSASMPFPWGTAHKISFIPSLPTQHTASAEMQVQVCECKR